MGNEELLNADKEKKKRKPTKKGVKLESPACLGLGHLLQSHLKPFLTKRCANSVGPSGTARYAQGRNGSGSKTPHLICSEDVTLYHHSDLFFPHPETKF